MSDQENQFIQEGKTYLILCEGKDEVNFLKNYLDKKVFASNKKCFNAIQVADFGGINKLRLAVETWSKFANFPNLKSFVVVRDAEDDANAAVDSIKGAFKNAGLPVPSKQYQFKLDTNNHLKTGFFLFRESPFSLTGTLEDLCLSILEEKEPVVISKIDGFLSDLEKHEIRTFPRRFKTRLHTYFSITDKFVSLKIGEAADAGAFDWNSSKLDQMKSFLEEMIR